MDRGAWWATVHGVSKSWTRLSSFHFLDFLDLTGAQGVPSLHWSVVQNAGAGQEPLLKARVCRVALSSPRRCPNKVPP